MSERQFGYGLDKVEENGERHACPAVVALDTDETDGVVAEVASEYDRQSRGEDGDIVDTISHDDAKQAWLDAMEEFAEGKPRYRAAREVAEKLDWI